MLKQFNMVFPQKFVAVMQSQLRSERHWDYMRTEGRNKLLFSSNNIEPGNDFQ